MKLSKLIYTLIITSTITTSLISTTPSEIVKATISNSTLTINDFEINDYNENQEVEQLTPKEFIKSEQKLNEAEEYILEKQQNKAYNQMKTLNYDSSKFQVQKQDWWCGPGAAYNAIVSKSPNLSNTVSQNILALDLGTTTQTPFGSLWANTMNLYLPGNNYTRTMGSDYSDWFTKFKNCIIYTIDKGYPIIIDTYQGVGQSNDKYISDEYRKIINDRNKEMYHYAAIIGYDDRPGNDRVLIVDSYKGVPRVYWTYTKWIANTTKKLGILW